MAHVYLISYVTPASDYRPTGASPRRAGLCWSPRSSPRPEARRWLDIVQSIADMLVGWSVDNRMICAWCEAALRMQKSLRVADDLLDSGDQPGGCLLAVGAEDACLLERGQGPARADVPVRDLAVTEPDRDGP